jgi:fused signal recognition particle receptor
VVFAVAQELGLPVRFVGTGETLDDLTEFDAEAFVEGLFES